MHLPPVAVNTRAEVAVSAVDEPVAGVPVTVTQSPTANFAVTFSVNLVLDV